MLWTCKKFRKKDAFPYMLEYNELKDCAKWQWDESDHEEDVLRRSGQVQETPIRARLERVSDESSRSGSCNGDSHRVDDRPQQNHG